MPAYVSVASDYSISSGTRTNFFTFKFKYEQPPEKYEADGSEQTLEINIKIPCESPTINPWAEYNSGGLGADYPTSGAGWTTNIPGQAHPFEDVMYLDECNDPNQDVSVGFGVGDMSKLSVGTEYFVNLRTNGPSVGTVGYEPQVKLIVQTGTNYDTDDPPFPWSEEVPLEKTCSYSSQAETEWNFQNSTGFKHRKKAAWCSWPDYQHRVIEPGSGNPVFVGHGGTEYKRYLNLINQDPGQSNDGRMERTDQNPDNSSWTAKSYFNSISLSTVCSGAYEANCMLQLSGSPLGFNEWDTFGWADHIQSFTSIQGDQLSAGAEVQCLPNSGTGCKLALLLYGYNFNGGGVPNNIEFKRIMTTIPDNGSWYLCRIDNGGWENNVGTTPQSHQDDAPGQDGLGNHTFGWQKPGTKDRLEIAIGTRWDDSHWGTPVTLNIDNVHVGGKSQELDPNGGYPFTPSGVGEVENTSICTQGIF